MANLLRMSEATALALHTMVYLARDPEHPVPAREIAGSLHASEAHLAKVLQRLSRAGLVKAQRGPTGGYSTTGNGAEITLLEVYEAIEGSLRSNHCLFEAPVCDGGDCIMGDLLERIHEQVRSYLSETRLSDLIETHEGIETHA